MYYDVDKDVVYYACLEYSELIMFIILCLFVWELLKYVVRNEFLK